MQGKKCRQCLYWAEPRGCDLSAEDSGGVESECRRYAPGLVDAEGVRIWPVTRAEDWCGEFKTRWGSFSCSE